MQRFVNSVVVPQLDGSAEQKPKFQPGEAPHVRSNQAKSKKIKQERQDQKSRDDPLTRISKSNNRRTTFDDDTTTTSASSVVQVEDSQIGDQRDPFAVDSQDDCDEEHVDSNEAAVGGVYSNAAGFLDTYQRNVAQEYAIANHKAQQSLAFDQQTDGYPGTTDGVPSLLQIDPPEPAGQAPIYSQRPIDRYAHVPVGNAQTNILRGAARSDLHVQRPPSRTGTNPNEGTKRAAAGSTVTNGTQNDRYHTSPQENIYSRQMVEQANPRLDGHYRSYDAMMGSRAPAAVSYNNRVASLHHPNRLQATTNVQESQGDRLQQNMPHGARITGAEKSASVSQPSYTAPTRNDKVAQALDYDSKRLFKMSYTDLREQDFDEDPSMPSNDDSDGEFLNMSLEDRIEYLLDQDEEIRFGQFSRLSLADWEQAGTAIMGELSKVMQHLFKVRGEKREVARTFEEQVHQRHMVVEKRKRLTDDALHRMKAGGVELITPTPKKAKVSK